MPSKLELEIQTLMDQVIISHEEYVANPYAHNNLFDAITQLYRDIDEKDPAFSASRRACYLARLHNMPNIFSMRVALLSYNAFYAARKLGQGNKYICEGIAYLAAYHMIELLIPLKSEI